MSRFADLHIHTNFSDSTSSPKEVVEKALKNGLCCIAITDHDVMDGVVPAQEAAQGKNFEVIPGIEFSSDFERRDIHILGYLLDQNHDELRATLHTIQESRISRIKSMIFNLKSQGISNIEFEEVSVRTESRSVGRPHLAAVMVEKGWVNSHREAFDRYLGNECPAYVPKFSQTPYQVIQLIRRAGGVPVMAHPMVTQKDELIPGFVDAGLQGIEVYYPNYSNNTVSFYEKIAQKHNLIVTGGSDDHGSRRDTTYIGKKKVPYETVEKLKSLSQINLDK